MRQPAKGHYVMYHPCDNDNLGAGREPVSALVVEVRSEACVNVALFASNGDSLGGKSDVLLYQGEGVFPAEGRYCEYPGDPT